MGRRVEVRINKKTRKALLESIEKWKLIVEGKEVDKGISNCSLCQTFDDCENCIVNNGCEGTPEFSKQCPSCLEGKLTYLDYKNVFLCNLCATEILRKERGEGENESENQE